MYEELVKRLMFCRNNAAIITDEELVEIAEEAADAIEELQRQIDAWVEPERKALIKSLPKWIPVTERLPDKNGKYLCNVKRFGQYAGKQYYYVDVLVFQEDSFFEDRIGTERVTHWMPLPEPPKEET